MPGSRSRPPTGSELIARQAELAAREEPFALATVVRRTPPSSARPGFQALITADGTLEGWLGGACIEPTVRREAIAAMREGRPRLVLFVPEPGERRAEGHTDPASVVHPMTCHSGGTVEIYVEPRLPSPVLALFGDSPVNRALAAIAPTAGFRAHSMIGPADAAPPCSEGYAVVATMGEWDEEAVALALEAGAAYVGVVASPRRATEIRRAIAARLGEEPASRLVSPAGLDIGAVEPGEIAVTILAQIVERRRRPGTGGAASAEGPADAAAGRTDAAVPGSSAAGRTDATVPGSSAETAAESFAAAVPSTAVDPVCGMDVEVVDALHTYEHDGTLYYFCCPRCRRRFSHRPEEWATT